jgi:hypothetical protein
MEVTRPSRIEVSRLRFFTRALFALAASAFVAHAGAARPSQQRLAARSQPSQSKPSESKSSESKPSQAESPRAKTPKSERPRDFQRAAGVPADKPSGFDFTFGRYVYRVNVTGNGYRHKGKDERRFNLHFGPGEEVSYLFYAKFRGDILLLCEVRGERGGTAYAVRLEQPSMRARWTTNIPATGTGEPAFDGQRLYVTGKNFVGAYDIETGEYLWLLDKFPGTAEEFTAFDAPEPRGREVLFRTRPAYNGASRMIAVDKKRGEIVRAE